VRNTNAIVALVLGILSLFGFGCLTGIPAWIVGNNAIREIDSRGGDPSDRTLAVVGKVIGMVTTLVTAGALLLVIAFPVVLTMFARG